MMSANRRGAVTFLSIPLELRNMIYLEVARTYILSISGQNRRITLADERIDNACCAMHRKRPTSTALSLALTSQQVALEARQIAFHHTQSPISVYFPSVCTLADFECQSKLYQPEGLRELCLYSARNVLVNAPSAWQALPLPGDCFKGLGSVEVTGIEKVFDIQVLRASLSWEGWSKDEESSSSLSWVFLRIE